jgi:hypothetical protein
VERARGGTEARMRFRIDPGGSAPGHPRGSLASATSPPAPRLSTTR